MPGSSPAPSPGRSPIYSEPVELRNGRRPSTRWLVVLILAPLVLLGVLATSPAQAASAADGDGQRVVRVGTEGTYPPFTYVDPRTSQLTGYDIEVIEAVAQEAGWKLKFVQSPFDAIFPALDAKRIDVIANQVTINPEREARYLFYEAVHLLARCDRHRRRHRRHQDPRGPEGQDHRTVGDQQLGPGRA